MLDIFSTRDRLRQVQKYMCAHDLEPCATRGDDYYYYYAMIFWRQILHVALLVLYFLLFFVCMQDNSRCCAFAYTVRALFVVLFCQINIVFVVVFYAFFAVLFVSLC